MNKVRNYTNNKVSKRPKCQNLIHFARTSCNAKASSFTDENWNVVCPIDNFGYEQCGSWWLGENNDFFIKELMLRLIEKVKEITGGHRLYFWGSTINGGMALFYMAC